MTAVVRLSRLSDVACRRRRPLHGGEAATPARDPPYGSLCQRQWPSAGVNMCLAASRFADRRWRPANIYPGSRNIRLAECDELGATDYRDAAGPELKEAPRI
jgi:hypothetical protein